MSDSTRPAIVPDELDFRSFTRSDPVTVLCVDDESDLLDLTALYLERENAAFEVITETDPASALERLDDTGDGVDCIVSDYQMPEMNGIEFLEAVRAEFPTLPFILFTGKGSEEVAGQAISAGVTDYLQKEQGTDQYTVLANRITNSVKQSHAERDCEQLLTAIETAREGISLLDTDGYFVYVNSAYAETYGYESRELVGTHWKRLYPDADVERVREELVERIPETGVLRDQTEMQTADGETIVVDHALAYTREGFLVCNINTLSETLEGQDLLVNVFDALDDLLFFFDESGSLEFWNGRIEEITGLEGAELRGLSPSEFVHEDDQGRVEDYIWETHDAEQARVEARLKTESGGTIPYEFISKRVTDAHGDLIGRIVLGRDISKRERYQRQIERQNERLEYFGEVLSHDLRNPLSIAHGRLDLLYETGEEEHYQLAKTALDRMGTIITDILDLAKTGARIDEREFEPADIEAIADQSWAMIRSQQATLEVEETSKRVEADASRLQQLLENLLRNAIEHGGSTVTVRIGILEDGQGFYVEDDGPGIPEDRRVAVYEAGHSTKTDGTGFGLATVKQLVDAHDWRIQITDSDDGGARFEIRGVRVIEE